MRAACALVLLAACGRQPVDSEPAFDASIGTPPPWTAPALDASVPPSPLECAGNPEPSPSSHSSDDAFLHLETDDTIWKGDYRFGTFRERAVDACGERGVYFVKDICGMKALAACTGQRCLYLQSQDFAPDDPAGVYFDGSGACQEVRRVAFTLDAPVGDVQTGRVVFEVGATSYAASFTACAFAVPNHTCR